MTINDVITKYYDELHASCTGDKVISQSRTEEDILNDVCMTAIRKFKRSTITEEEGIAYLRKNIAAEKHFQYNRKKGEILIYVDNPTASFDKGIDPPEME